jgi:GxxExxY protein
MNLLGAFAALSASVGTLDQVKARGQLICGANRRRLGPKGRARGGTLLHVLGGKKVSPQRAPRNTKLMYAPIPTQVEAAARQCIDAALQVHKSLGPGLLESAYEHCLAHELGRRGIKVERQLALPIVYEGERLDAGYRLDLVVDGCVIVEVKSLDALAPIHDAQVLTYLKLSGLRVGLLINFNVILLKQGLKRFVL